MHRDKKIGFALGILLLGIVAAFFFRNEPDPFAELPPLDDPAGLDAQIAEKPITPYTEELGQPAKPNTGSNANPWEIPDIYRPGYRQQPTGENPPAVPGAPAPITLADPAQTRTDEPNPVIEVRSPFQDTLPNSPAPRTGSPIPGNEAWTTVNDDAPVPFSQQPAGTVSNRRTFQEDTPASPAAMYQIRKGDTLSVLAEKHLGSSRRYMEIYQANRDKLRNPDDIQVGMLIRIPPRVQFSDGNSPKPRDANTPPQPPANTQPPTDDANLFTPFSRSPLAPQRN